MENFLSASFAAAALLAFTSAFAAHIPFAAPAPFDCGHDPRRMLLIERARYDHGQHQLELRRAQKRARWEAQHRRDDRRDDYRRH